jgi:prophage tail gpP-like protein
MSDNAVVVINGQPFDGWTEFSIDQSFDEASGTATLTFTEQPENKFPIDVGFEAQIILAGQPAITGNVREVTTDHSWTDHTFQATIRDRTQDFVQSTIGPGNSYQPPVTLKQVLEGTLGKMGLSKIRVIDEVSPEPYGAGEVVAGSIDDRGFLFGDAWAQKRQTVLNTDGSGNLVIARNQMQKRASASLTKMFEPGPANNILTAKYRTADLNRANETEANAQKSTNHTSHWETRPKGDPDAQAGPLATAKGKAIDAAIRKELKLHLRAQKGINGQSPERAARWISNVAKARDYEYTAVVQGFTMGPGGKLWWPGYLVPVVDQHCRISAELFIQKVRFTKSFKDGAKTEITCAPKEAFSEQAGGSTADGRTSSTGAGDPG